MDYAAVPAEEPAKQPEAKVQDSSSDVHGQALSQANTNTHGTLPQPDRLYTSVFMRVFRLVVDVVIIASTVLFLVFGCLISRYDGTLAEPGTIGKKLYDAAQYGPTIFPLLFSAVVSGCLRNLTLWRLQSPKGATAEFVAQCLGSQSVSRAFLTPVILNALNPLTAALVVLWCFSPLGSQAVLRIVSLGVEPATVSSTLNSVATYANYSYGFADGMSQAATLVRNPVTASLLTTKLLGSRNQDLWGSIRFPIIEHLEANASITPLADGWLPVPEAATLDTYASLVGTPVSGLPATGNTTFRLPGSYMHVTCGSLDRTSRHNLTNFTSSDAPQPAHAYDCGWSSGSVGAQLQMAFTEPCNSTVGGHSAAVLANQSRPARQFLWESRGGVDGKTVYSQASCTLTTTYVELQVQCAGSSSNNTAGSSCAAASVRRAEGPDANWTVLDTGFQNDAHAVAVILMGLYPQAEVSGGIEPLIVFMSNPTDILGATMGSARDIPVDTLDVGTVETRLTQLLNTVLYLGIDGPTMAGGNFQGAADGTRLEAVAATNAHDLVVMRCHRGWLGVLLVASLLMLLTALASTVLRTRTVVPDLFDSLSLAFLHNRTPSIRGSSAWSASEWAQKTRLFRLRLGDVQPDGDKGRIALAEVGDAVVTAGVRAGRTYV